MVPGAFANGCTPPLPKKSAVEVRQDAAGAAGWMVGAAVCHIKNQGVHALVRSGGIISVYARTVCCVCDSFVMVWRGARRHGPCELQDNNNNNNNNLERERERE